MIKEREFYVWNTDLNKMIGVILIDNEMKEIVTDSLSSKEITSIGSN